MNLHFDQPLMLLLALAIVPMVALGWRWLRVMDPLRRVTVLGVRSALLAILAVALAGPRTVREHDHLTVIGVLDLSGSVKRLAQLPQLAQLADGTTRSNVAYLREWFRRATKTRADDDRFGLIVFDGKASVVSVPETGPYIDDNLDVTLLQGTNIAEAIELALAMFPADTSRRIVLLTDGSETAGDAIAAARQAAAGARSQRATGGSDPAGTAFRQAAVPIDVIPITYSVRGDVQVLRAEAPPWAQAGQTITVRVVLEATRPTRGRLLLQREGRAVDLNGQLPGTSRRVEVPAGRSVHLAQIRLGETPINRFEAVFEPDDPADDALVENNRAETFTATPSRGIVLVLDPRAGERPNELARVLQADEIPTHVRPPGSLAEDVLSLQLYDLIVLDNVAASELDATQHELLARWVRDLGGGLIMIGGEHGFGAGGWNGTALEEVLPLELDPPKELRLATAALVLVLDKSGSMNQRVQGTRASQQQIANEAAAMAIESLRRESLVGVVTFDLAAHVRVPLQPNEDPGLIAREVRGISADGGTNLAPALRAAHRMLGGVETKNKLVVCLSDGRSHSRDLEAIVKEMAADDIKLTTIAVGDAADHATLKKLAEIGGGQFYPVQNPRTLPRMLVDAVQVINKPLLKEVPFQPVILPTGSTLTSTLLEAPILEGLVITTRRLDPKVAVEATHPEGEPLLAHWQVGLGRVAAFTSDADGGWSHRWIDWPGYATFWTHLARTISRPATNPETELLTRITGGRLHVTLEATDEERGFLDYLHVDGVVYGPDGSSRTIRLTQTAPGLYEASMEATAAGNYIVALSPRRGSRRLAPVIGGASQPQNPEFRRLESNPRLLEQLVEITGGRLLTDMIGDPDGANLFDRTGLPKSRSALPAWPILLWLALGLAVVDVASRRLAWDYGLFRGLLARALARVAPRERLGRRATATLASLRRATVPTPRPEGRQEPEGQGSPRPGREPEPAPEPTASNVSDALEAFLGKTQPASTEAGDTDSDDTPPAGETPATPATGSLLAAKRRARKRMDR